jgi:hypothetical protein
MGSDLPAMVDVLVLLVATLIVGTLMLGYARQQNLDHARSVMATSAPTR